MRKGYTDEARDIARAGVAGLLWSKQFYITRRRNGCRAIPFTRSLRRSATGRNSGWLHLYNRDVISMPDNWEFPWYASWDLAFHMVAFAEVDPQFAKDQLVLLLREWYMHPSGQIPAYEFEFGDVNPPVHAWAAWRVYKIAGPAGQRDRAFPGTRVPKADDQLHLVGPTAKTWRAGIFSPAAFWGWIISAYSTARSRSRGGVLEQADGSAWMAFYCLTMLSMALELAREDPVYEDVASKFFEHFIAIADAINTAGRQRACGTKKTAFITTSFGLVHGDADESPLDGGIDSPDGGGSSGAGDNRSAAGIPQTDGVVSDEPERPVPADFHDGIGRLDTATGAHRHRLLGIPTKSRLRRVLERMLDEDEFFSPFGIRSLSAQHREHPYVLRIDGQEWRVQYEPGESQTALFGGNSNWRGPVWFPMNYLLMESLERYHHFYGDDFKVECPAGSGHSLTLREVAREINRRLCGIFLPDAAGRAAWQGETKIFGEDPHWRGQTWFHEYFHGDTGRGCGASHQTGWTALIARCLRDLEAQSAATSSDSRTSTGPRQQPE